MNLGNIFVETIEMLNTGIKKIFLAFGKFIPEGIFGELLIIIFAFTMGYFLKGWFFKQRTKIYWITIVLGLLIYLLLKMGMIV